MAPYPKSRSHVGMTVLEGIVAVAVISLLGFATLEFTNTSEKTARDAQRFTDLHDLERALGLYMLSNGTFPKATVAQVLTGYDSVSTSLLQSGVLRDIPLGPMREKFPYAYMTDHDGNHYRILFCLESSRVAGYAANCENVIEH